MPAWGTAAPELQQEPAINQESGRHGWTQQSRNRGSSTEEPVRAAPLCHDTENQFRVKPSFSLATKISNLWNCYPPQTTGLF